jgi:hypothetical protein
VVDLVNVSLKIWKAPMDLKLWVVLKTTIWDQDVFFECYSGM